MASEEAARHFSFRLPPSLVERVESCAESIREEGLDLTRADVVGLLLKHALDTTQCKLELLLGKGKPLAKRRARQRVRE